MKKFKSPKIKIRAASIFWAVFLLVVAWEAYFLYSSLYLGFKPEEVEEPQALPVSSLDLDTYYKAAARLETSQNYAPTSTAIGGTTGRANPMAEY